MNVRQDSDVDVGVMLYQYFLSQYPDGKANADFGNSDADYGYAQFKNELEEALVAHFGRSSVTRGNKAFDITANSYHVEADVVPLFEFRTGSYRAGVALIPDNSGRRIENYPERLIEYWPQTPLHYENGVSKNTATSRRFKGIGRILKRLRIELDDAEDARAKPVRNRCPATCLSAWPGTLQTTTSTPQRGWTASNRCFGISGRTPRKWRCATSGARSMASSTCSTCLNHGRGNRRTRLSMQRGTTSESRRYEA